MVGEVSTSESYFDEGVWAGLFLLVADFLYILMSLVLYIVIPILLFVGAVCLLINGFRRAKERFTASRRDESSL